VNFALQDIAAHWFEIFEPAPRMTVSEWANERRVLSPEGSAHPGKYSSDATPYAVEWMDSVNDPTCTGTILMVASQLGKTEVVNNVVGYFIDIEPAPVLMVQPTIDLAEAWSKERLAPMIRDTPALNGKVADAKSRDSGNTILHKIFPGGNLAIAGANAPSGLASRPRRVVLCDEEDRFPISAGNEGDPVSLAIRRTENFWNSVVFETSTPTVKGLSRIEKRWEESDQRRWWCPCPACGHLQTLKWSQVRYVAEDGSDAWYLCENPACKDPHRTDEERRKMVRAGRWIATFPHRALRGYHLNGIANLFRHKKGYTSRLHQMVADHLSAKAKGKEALRTWVNTFLAETWEDEGEKPAWEPLMARRENWGEFPAGGLVITAGVDIQGDRVEVEIVAWGEGEESWSLQHRTIIGSFHSPGVQQELDDILGQKWRHPLSGVELAITATLIDSGNKPRAVYAYTKRRASRCIFAVKGRGGPGLPVVSRPTKQGVERALLFTVGTDTIKDTIYARLTLADLGPGYMHFPSDRPEDWFRQLVAETKVTRYRDGVPFSKFENPSNSRNEALDLRVYAIGALGLLNVNWKRLKAAIIPPKEEKPEGDTASPPAEKPKRQARRAGGFVSNW
jgi:phage terminase large subunit GpA-like protein